MSLSRYFSNPQAPSLIASLILGVFGLTLGFSIFFPFLLALMIAYLQQGAINKAAQYVSYKTAVIGVFSLTISLLALGIFGFIPFIYDESLHFVQDFPNMVTKASEVIKVHSGVEVDLEMKLREIFVAQSESLMNQTLGVVMHYLPSAMSFMIYLVTIPVLIFFFNYDKVFFTKNLRALYPAKAPELELIGKEILEQIHYYVQGKIVHMVIIGFVSFILFWAFSLRYALFLAVSMGLSVFIPFVGTVLATLPLALISYAQFGLSAPTLYILGGHGLIHLWNENILVPMIFSKSNDMHPLTILGSVLIFGHLLGILGVFLAIPLTAILKICILRWPSEEISN